MLVLVQQNGKLISQYIFEKDDLITGAELFIGRSDDCHIVLENNQISRHHIKLKIKDDGIYLDKLSNLGKVTVNGNEVLSQKIENDDAVGVLDYSLMFKNIEFKSYDEESYTQKMNSIPDDDLPTLEDFKTEIYQGEPLVEEEEEEVEEKGTEIEASANEEEVEENDDFFEEKESNEFSDSSEGDAFSESNEFSENENEEEDAFGSFGEDQDVDSFDGGFGAEDDVGESTQVFKSFASYSLKLFGEHAPYDKYLIEDKEIFVGRDPEKCQIVLNDHEVSSVHAVIRKNLINCTIEDLNSSNGTILNGDRINKVELKHGDEFLIGTTSFTVEVSSDLIKSESDRLMPVADGQVVEVEEIVEEEVDFNEMEDGNFSVESAPQEKSFIKRILKDKKKRPIVWVVGLLLVWLALDDGDSGKDTKKPKAEEAKTAETQEQVPQKKEFSPEILEKLEQNYVLALAKYDAGEYYQAREYLDTIVAIDPNYKDTQTILGLVKQGYEELSRLKAEEQAEKERRARQLEVEKLVEKAREATKNREVVVAESLFTQILEKDPENIDVPQMRLELNAYKEAEQNKKIEEARLKALRQNKVDALAPGKALYLRGEWFEAINQLEKFLKIEGMDEDLISEATDMMRDSKINLSNIINPLLGKARSFKEGQDLKNAFEVYGEVLRYDPSNEEALMGREEIQDELTNRSKKLYRDALISESLSLFSEAREKFEEVQQISPTNSEYYEKATEKLQDYILE